MYLLDVHLPGSLLSVCSSRFARSASKQSDEHTECGTPSLNLRLPWTVRIASLAPLQSRAASRTSVEHPLSIYVYAILLVVERGCFTLAVLASLTTENAGARGERERRTDKLTHSVRWLLVART